MPADDGQTDKVISLRGHQAAEEALDALLSLDRSNPRYEQAVVAASRAGQQVLQAIVRRLDSANASSLFALGDVIVHYPARVHAVQALLRAAGDARSSDNRRLGAMLVLITRYLRAPSAEEFALGLQHPPRAIGEALAGAVTLCETRPIFLRECTALVASLISQPPDLLYSVAEQLQNEEEDSGAVRALRLLALHPHPDIARAAIESLIGSDTREAFAALAALEPNVSAEDAQLVTRHLQKLRLSGSLSVRSDVKTEPGCRALVGPVDGLGRRVVWLQVPVSPSVESGMCVRLGLEMSNNEGIVAMGFAAGNEMPHFPEICQVGRVHPSLHSLPENRHALGSGPFVETPFEYGLAALRDGVWTTWDAMGQLPLEYRLCHYLVWRFGNPPEQNQEPHVSASHAPGLGLASEEDALLADPLFSGWHLQSDAVLTLAGDLLRSGSDPPRDLEEGSWEVHRAMLFQLAQQEFTSPVRGEYARRLQTMAEWLKFAGRVHEAQVAESAAATMTASPPEANRFVLRLIQKALLVSLSRLRSGKYS